MSKKILVAYDGSELSRNAVEEAKVQAKQNPGAEVHAISVVTHAGPSSNIAISRSFMEDLADEIRPSMQRIKNEFEEEGIPVVSQVIVDYSQRNPGVKICEYADDNGIDLIVIASRGLGGIKRLFLGSVSNNVVQHAASKVLVVK